MVMKGKIIITDIRMWSDYQLHQRAAMNQLGFLEAGHLHLTARHSFTDSVDRLFTSAFNSFPLTVYVGLGVRESAVSMSPVVLPQ